MGAVWTKIRADLRRRKLQSAVIAVVIMLASGAATLALNLLVESDAPYDHAFAQANGAHLTARYAGDKVTASQLAATAHMAAVTQAAGPWPATTVWTAVSRAGKGPAPAGGGPLAQPINLVGRDRPNTPVDRLALIAGRWATAPGELVAEQSLADSLGLQVGARLTTDPAPGPGGFQVVGIAAGINRDADAWVMPGQVAALVTPKAGLHYQMVYRVSPAATADDLHQAGTAITAGLPAGAVEQMGSYLAVKLEADRLTAVMIPFLIAFSAFALLAAAFIIANIVTGVVIASYREIGVMKAVGFTPGQVVTVLLGQILGPAILGCLLGLPLGLALSQPFLADTAHALGLPTAFTAAAPVVVAVLGAVLGVAVGAACAPAWRAGHLSAVAAITAGSAPAPARGADLARAFARLPLPRTLSLGLGDAVARPLRAALTLGAILVGVATVIFALGLNLGLGRVAAGIIRDQAVQVRVMRTGTFADTQITALLAADPATAHYVAEGQTDAAVPGIAAPVAFYAYRGAASWTGYPLIAGRWFAAPGEVVAPTHLLRLANLQVGDTFSGQVAGRPVTLHVVGSILDQTDDNLLLRGDWAALAAGNPGAQPAVYEVQLRPGTAADAYAARITDQAPADALRIRVSAGAAVNTAFLLLESVVTGLALVLTAIAVAGVLNTVILNTGEQVRDIAILKAVGMAPGQVVTMIVAAVAGLGVIAGGLGIPIGLALQHGILQTMASIATDTELPADFYTVLDPGTLLLLALSGIVVAVLGAWLPARWAAAHPVAEVLQAE